MTTSGRRISTPANARRAVKCALFGALLCAGPYTAMAVVHSGTGTVHTLDTTDLTTFGANADWFELNGVTGLGSCGVWNQGTLFRVKDDAHGQQMYAMLMSAYVSGIPVTVYADDTYKDSSGYCYAEQVSFGSLPP